MVVEVMEMPDYQQMYLTLFNAVTDALTALEQRNLGQAAALLRAAQQETEAIFVDTAP